MSVPAPGAGPDPGELLELDIGAVAHGGHCVARDGGGRVVFVRHALPGERVLARVTERRRGYLRADAVEIRTAAPERVAPPCPHAGPPPGPATAPGGGAAAPAGPAIAPATAPATGCGGCDFQHVAPAAQRELKAAVVREQLARLAGLPAQEVDALGVRVQELPGGPLGWRTRVRYAVDGAGRPGLLAHRSHQVVPVGRCRIAVPAIQDLPVTGRRWPGADHVEVVASSGGDLAVRTWRARSVRRVGGPAQVRETAAGRRWRVPAGSFWQVHPAAPETLVAAVLDLLDPRPGERVLDLYAGVGLFAAALAPRVAPGAVIMVESDRRAVASARHSLGDLPGVRIEAATVDRALRGTGPADLVVLDPPRSGAGRAVVRAVTGTVRPRAVAYVACDPAALARDVGTFRAAGWRLAALRAFDAFPMTHHVECVGLLVPG